MRIARNTLLISSLVLAGATSSFAFSPDSVKDDQLQVVISLNEQRLEVFRGNETIAKSRVSSGKPGYSTPTGIFSILDKRKFHRSNIYSNAPMPFMQRLTWTGIALHGSNSVPNYPASHGCIRLPDGFDKELYAMTNAGVHVIVNGDMVEPKSIAHAVLPQPSSVPGYDPQMDQWRLRVKNGASLVFDPSTMVSTADMLMPVRHKIGPTTPEAEKPLRILITRRAHPETAQDIQRMLNDLGFDAGAVDGLIGRDTQAAIRRFEEAHEMPITGTATPSVVEALYHAAGVEQPTNAQLSVRQNFEPVFDAPISLDDPEKPIGTHLLVSAGFDRAAGKTEWNAFTLENRIGDNSRALLGIDPDADAQVPLEETLDRIHIPAELQARLAGMLTPGTSITITDNGTERYTGWKTDFVVNTIIERDYIASVRPPAVTRTVRRNTRTREVNNFRRPRPADTVRYQRYQRPLRQLMPIFNGYWFAR